MYAEFLQAKGLSAVTATSIEESFEKIRNHALSVIVTDLMPDREGGAFEVIERYRQHAPVLVMTGWALPFAAERARASGAFAFLMKPCAPDTLLVHIQHVLMQAPGS